MKKTKANARLASEAVLDSVQTVMEDDIVPVAPLIATLHTLPCVEQVLVLRHVKRSREVCKRWKQIQDESFYQEVLRNVSWNARLMHYTNPRGMPTNSALRTVGLGMQLVDRGVVSMKQLQEIFRIQSGLAGRVMHESSFEKVRVWLEEYFPFLFKDNFVHTRRSGDPTVWGYIFPVDPEQRASENRFDITALTFVRTAYVSDMPEALIEAALNRILDEKKCLDPENLSWNLVCAAMPLRIVKIAIARNVENKLEPEFVFNPVMTRFASWYLESVAGILADMSEYIAQRAFGFDADVAEYLLKQDISESSKARLLTKSASPLQW